VLRAPVKGEALRNIFGSFLSLFCATGLLACFLFAILFFFNLFFFVDGFARLAWSLLGWPKCSVCV
jgi:hypothetical protein